MTLNRPMNAALTDNPPDPETEPWAYEGQCDVCLAAHKVYKEFNMSYESGATLCLDCLKSAVDELEAELAAQ